jgi:hypothetical protein
LLKSLGVFRRHEWERSVWWTKYKNIAGMVLPVAATQNLFDVESGGSWDAVEDDLEEVVGSSETGERLFGQALRDHRVTCIGRQIDAQVKKLIGRKIDLTAVNENRIQMSRIFEKHMVQPYEAFKAKKVPISYRGVAFQCTVTTPMEHFVAQQSMFIRGLAVELGTLDKLFCEDDLVEAPVLFANTTVDAAVIADNKSARMACLNFLDARDRDSGDAIRHMLIKKQPALQQLDAKIYLEINFFLGLTGEGADARALSKVLCLLPCDDDTPYSIAEALLKVRELQTSKLMKFVGLAIQAHLMTTVAWLEALSAGRSPRFDTTLPPFLDAVKSHLSKYCTCPSGSGTKLVGFPAIQAMYKVFEDTIADGNAILYIDIAGLLKFFWMLTADQQKTVKASEATCSDTNRPARDATTTAASSKPKIKRRKTIDPKSLLASLMA